MAKTKLVANCETGEVLEIEMTPEEIKQFEEDAKKFAAEQAKRDAEANAKEEAKASAIVKLAALGLTEEEAKAIVN